MAYVGITPTLMYRIRQRIESLERAELNLCPSEELNITGNESWFEEAMWGNTLALRDQVPPDWFATSRQFLVQFSNIPDPTGATADKHYFEYTANLPQEIRFPPNARNRHGYLAVCPSTVPPSVAPVIAATFARKEVRQKWEKIRQEVEGFIESCKSLNEAVRLLPQIAPYIPQDYQNKMAEKRTSSRSKSAASEVVKNIDGDALTAAAVLARMAGANV